MTGQFIRVSCNDCGSETIMYSHASSMIPCETCGATLAKPAGGKALLTGGRLVEVVSEGN